MSEEYKQYILRQVGEQDGDNLERAKAAFGRSTEVELDLQYGQSGKTRRQLLQEYQERRDFHLRAYAWLEDKLK